MNDLRAHYLRWLRRAAVVLALPLVLIAALQVASAATWWDDPAPDAGSARYLFISVAVASVVVGRSARTRDTARLPLDEMALRSLSWRLVVYACAPVVIGAVLAFMTRQTWDFYLMLLVTLIGVAVLFPRFDQWVAWSRQPDGGQP